MGELWWMCPNCCGKAIKVSQSSGSNRYRCPDCGAVFDTLLSLPVDWTSTLPVPVIDYHFPSILWFDNTDNAKQSDWFR